MLAHVKKQGSFFSPALGRAVPYTLYLPAAYDGNRGTPFPALYLLHGGSSHHAEWGEQMPLEEMLAPYPLVVLMPEGEHGLYLNGDNGQRHGDAALVDAPAFLESTFRVATAREGRAMAGLSMGGFGAFNLGLQHPERFAALASLSGAFGMTWWNLGKREGSPYRPALGPEGSAVRQAYDPWRILETATARHGRSQLPAMRLDVGLEDDPDVVEANRNYHRSLLTARVPHEYVERPGGHDWDYWRAATPDLLAFVAKALKAYTP